MEIDLVIKNYRCFQKPARITLRRGFTAFVGVNNSGKSSLLKFFYEFRNLFVTLSGSPDSLCNAIKGQALPVNLIGVQDTKEVFNNSKRIFGYDRLEINPSDDDTTLQLIINHRPYKLSELGSGIAQFIVVLANAVLKGPAFILLDEPELNLHPSLQLDFLTTLASYASDGILYATHSIGLARSNAERIYSVRKIAEGDSEVRDYEATPNLAQFVGELSFSSYQELGFNKILLVEGRSEVKTIQQFLRLWKKDHQIVLIPLGGATLINGSSELELRELKRISTNVSALIDSERVVEGGALDANRRAFVASCENLGINVSVLERRATENYFTDDAVKNVLGPAHRALAPYEKLNEVSPSWSKSENWRIAREMSIADLEPTDLGAFLRQLCAGSAF